MLISRIVGITRGDFEETCREHANLSAAHSTDAFGEITLRWSFPGFDVLLPGVHVVWNLSIIPLVDSFEFNVEFGNSRLDESRCFCWVEKFMAGLISNEVKLNQSLVIPWRDVSVCMDWLSQTYQTQFQIWDWDEQWSLLTPCEPHANPETNQLAREIICDLPENTSYRTQAISDDETLIIIPMESLTHRKRIATGLVSRKIAQGFHRVIQLYLDYLRQNRINADQTRQLQNFSSQTSIDFEELTWFRTLVDNLAFEETGSSLTPSARQALTSLKDLIHAESLIVVLKGQEHTKTLSPYDGIFTLGASQVEESLVTELLKMAGSNLCCQSFINNHVSQDDCKFSKEISSVVIIPAICRNYCFGWLIAINRQSHPCHDVYLNDHSIREHAQFNTKAALLMESAASVLATQAHNIQLFKEQQNILVGTVRTLVNALDTKDKYTCGHSDRVAQIAKAIAIQYGLTEEECQKIYLAGLLHDIGKIGVRDDVLSKPGKLTVQEFDEIKLHPVLGYEILKHLNQLQHVLPGVLFHHESWDGTGYPHQLDKEDIPLAARILAVADAYDAMTSDRPYRKGLPLEKAEQILRDGRAQQWDPAIVDTFFDIIEKVHKIVSGKQSSFNMPTLHSEYVFEEDGDGEDSICSAVFTTTSLSGIS